MYTSEKVIDGFSTCFRQWRADGTHCQFLHGYGIKFRVVFEADHLDARNWVQDFGFLSRSDFKFDGHQVKDWFKYMFDHTTVIASDDPELGVFKAMHDSGLIQLRVLNQVGCEKFAELVFVVLELMLHHEYQQYLKKNAISSKRRVRVRSVTCIEHDKNSATYEK